MIESRSRRSCSSVYIEMGIMSSRVNLVLLSCFELPIHFVTVFCTFSSSLDSSLEGNQTSDAYVSTGTTYPTYPFNSVSTLARCEMFLFT